MTRPRLAAAADVLLIANNFPPTRGGSAAVYANLARHAAGRIMVIAPRRSYIDGLPLIGWREHDRRAPYHVLRLPLLRTVMPSTPQPGILARGRLLAADLWIRARLVATVLGLTAGSGIRAVCVGELLASGWLLMLLRRLVRLGLLGRLRLLVYVHGEEITTNDLYDRDGTRRRRPLRSVDEIVVVSRFTEAAVRGLLRTAPAGHLRLAENGVDRARFTPRPRRPDLVALYRLEGRFVFVSICRLLEKKGIDNAIRAFAEVIARVPGCRYLVVGTGPYEATLRELAAELGLSGSVVFAGQVPEEDLVDHYCLGDVFVMPNRALANGDTEGFGLVFLEANACGLPVIAGRDGGSTDAVQDGVNGLVVDGHQPAAIGAAMIRLYADPALRRRLADGARDVAASAGWAEKTAAFLAACAPPARQVQSQ
jgi:phosphatidyl-myo-inositol dimannoside synthase